MGSHNLTLPKTGSGKARSPKPTLNSGWLHHLNTVRSVSREEMSPRDVKLIAEGGMGHMWELNWGTTRVPDLQDNPSL